MDLKRSILKDLIFIIYSPFCKYKQKKAIQIVISFLCLPPSLHHHRFQAAEGVWYDCEVAFYVSWFRMGALAHFAVDEVVEVARFAMRLKRVSSS